jgi:transposase-like protein
MDKLKDFLRISEAAEYLGVSPNTLRNWSQPGIVVSTCRPPAATAYPVLSKVTVLAWGS